jgi:rhomboid protease GluP
MPGPAQPAPPSPGPVAIRLPELKPRVTSVILGITILVFALQFLSNILFGFDLLIELGAKDNDAIRAGELWRFFTPMLLHGGIFHIGFNMYALYALGMGLERRLGHFRFLLLYILAGFAGNVFSFVMTLMTRSPSVGASTSVFGLIAAEGIFLYQNRKLFGREARQAMGNVLFVIMLNLFLGFSSGGLIDNWGHIGGLLGGAIFTLFGGPRWEVVGAFPDFHLEDSRGFRDILLGASMVIIIFGGLAVWGLAQ